jgi:hypothetical protein
MKRENPVLSLEWRTPCKGKYQYIFERENQYWTLKGEP